METNVVTDPSKPRKQTSSTSLNVPPSSCSNKTRKYHAVAKPVKHKSDIAYAFDKFENLVVSFMVDYTTAQEATDGNKASPSSLIYNIRRKLQLMTHLLKQFDPQIQIHLLDVMNELVKLMELQSNTGVDKGHLNEIMNIIEKYKVEIRKPVVGPYSSLAMDRTLRLSKFLVSIKKVLQLNPVLEIVSHDANRGQVPVCVGRRIYPTRKQIRTNIEKSSQTVSRNRGTTAEVEKVKPKTPLPGTLTEYLGGPMFPNIDATAPIQCFDSTGTNNSAYAQMILRRSSGAELIKPTSKLLLPTENETDFSSVSRKPFIWCTLRPVTSGPNPYLLNSSYKRDPMLPEMTTLEKAIHEYGLNAEWTASNKRTSIEKIQNNPPKTPSNSHTNLRASSMTNSRAQNQAENKGPTSGQIVSASSSSEKNRKYKIISWDSDFKDVNANRKKEFSFGTSTFIPDIRKLHPLVQTGVGRRAKNDALGWFSKLKACSNSNCQNEQTNYAYFDGRLHTPTSTMGSLKSVKVKTAKTTFQEPKQNQFVFEHSSGLPIKQPPKTPNPLDWNGNPRQYSTLNNLDDYNYRTTKTRRASKGRSSSRKYRSVISNFSS